MSHIYQNVYNFTRSQPLALVTPHLKENLELKTFGYLLCIITHDLRDWVHYFQLLQCFKCLKTCRSLHSDSLYA